MIDWQNIDLVMLDMDGTLLDLHFDDYFWQHYLPAHYAAKHAISLELAKEKLEPLFRAKEGSLQWYCLDYWTNTLDINIKMLKREMTQYIQEHDGTIAFLQFLKQLPREVWLVTNAHRDALELKLEFTSIEQYMDRIICSHDFKAAKEDQLFWQRLQQQFAFDKSRTLFVDDSPSVLASAARYGIGYLAAVTQPSSQAPARKHQTAIQVKRVSELIK